MAKYAVSEEGVAALVALSRSLRAINDDIKEQYENVNRVVAQFGDKLGELGEPILDLLTSHKYSIDIACDSIILLADNAIKKADGISEILSFDNPNGYTPSKIVKAQPYIEKGAAFIAAVESMSDIASAVAGTTSYTDLNANQQQVMDTCASISSRAYDYEEMPLDDLLTSMGYSVNNIETAMGVVSNVISKIGNDEDSALKSPDEIKSEIDEITSTLSLIKNDSNKSASPPDDNTLSVFSSTVSENPQFGEGGANQIFVPHANTYKQNGVLKSIDSFYEDKNGLIALSKFPPQLLINTDDMSGYSNISSEIDYLDQNTIDTEGLNMVVDSQGNLVSQSNEDFLHPHSNQEDSKGQFFPDSWKKSGIPNGFLLFQISSDGNTQSSYFTDSLTINSCVHNGYLNMKELKSKLQIADDTHKVCLSIYKYSCKTN